MARISIIVPVYNAENTLGRCLESIQAQTYQDFDVILINDGSVDNSRNICDTFSIRRNNFRVLHISNGGVSNARNLGIAESRSEYLTFIDADDTISPDYLAILLADESADFSLCGYKSIYSNGATVQETIEPLVNLEIKSALEKIIGHHLVRTVWGKLFKRSIIENFKIKFNASLKLGEDTIFVIEYLLNVKSVYATQSVGYIYYRPPATANRHNNTPEDLLNVYSEFLNLESQLSQLNYEIAAFKASNVKTIYFYFFNTIYSSGKFGQKERLQYYDKIIKVDGNKEFSFLSNVIRRFVVSPLTNNNSIIILDHFFVVYFFLLKLKSRRS